VAVGPGVDSACTWNVSWRVKAVVPRADNLTTFMC